MLTTHENELLTRVGPGTPMGQMMRQYWIPVLLSPELAPGGRVKRVRLLGEELVAFRGHDGRVGLLGEACSHRGASLYFGRNEKDALRCVYHGWQYGLDGRCLEFRKSEAGAMLVEEVAGQPLVPRWAGAGWPLSLELAWRLLDLPPRQVQPQRLRPDALQRRQ